MSQEISVNIDLKKWTGFLDMSTFLADLRDFEDFTEVEKVDGLVDKSIHI